MPVKSIFHINLNCTDLQRTVTFYEALGFKSRFTLKHDGPAGPEHRAVGIAGENLEFEARLLVAGDDLHQTRLDVMQYKEPESKSAGPIGVTGIGLRRISLRVTHLQDLYEDLAARGFEFISEPVGPLPELFVKSLVGLLDPDGVVVQLMEFLPASKQLYESTDE